MHDILNICKGHNAHRFFSSQIQFKNIKFIFRVTYGQLKFSLPYMCKLRSIFKDTFQDGLHFQPINVSKVYHWREFFKTLLSLALDPFLCC